MSGSWGRFTLRGDARVESQITNDVEQVKDVVARTLDPSSYRALVMIGGYGRGEGGVERISGVERPHNNYDFLVILERGGTPSLSAIKEKLDSAIAPIIKKIGIGIDIGLTTVRTLAHARCLVMWYDFRNGHKTILGDRSYVSGLKQFKRELIDPTDIRSLLVNRGTLLVINELLLGRQNMSTSEARTVVKHGVKAIIGYGDALLFGAGLYDWSYATKQQRMRCATVGTPEFRALYEEAMNFRFEPDYSAYLDRDLRSWNRSLLSALAEVHLEYERFRLGAPGIEWSSYFEKALRFQLLDGMSGLRGVVKKIVALRENRAVLGPLEPLARFGFRSCRPAEYLPMLFPVIAYDLRDSDYRHATREILNVRSDSNVDLMCAYLRAWGEHGDSNFMHVLDRLGLALQGDVKKRRQEGTEDDGEGN